MDTLQLRDSAGLCSFGRVRLPRNITIFAWAHTYTACAWPSHPGVRGTSARKYGDVKVVSLLYQVWVLFQEKEIRFV
jgi:hypothetical protein